MHPSAQSAFPASSLKTQDPRLDQPDLFTAPVDPADVDRLRAWLRAAGWQTRKQLCVAFEWSERQVREAAEHMGADIIRSHRGYFLTDQVTRDHPEDLASAIQAADAALSQAEKMQRYALALRKRLHTLIG